MTRTRYLPLVFLASITLLAACSQQSPPHQADATVLDSQATSYSVVGWGANYSSQANIPTAAQNDVVAIAAGAAHSLALKHDGSVVAWGWNENGQTNIPTEAQNVKAIAAGWQHNLVLKDDGSVVAWGRNFEGQTNIPTAAQNGVQAIAGGRHHSLALVSTNQPPTADPGGPYSGSEGTSIPLDGSNSFDPDTDPLSYLWSVDSSLCSFDDASLANPTLTCTDDGDFTLSLVVNDGSENSTSTSAPLTVSNLDPTLGSFGVTPEVIVGESVTATGSFSDVAADTPVGTLNWDDGTTGRRTAVWLRVLVSGTPTLLQASTLPFSASATRIAAAPPRLPASLSSHPTRRWVTLSLR